MGLIDKAMVYRKYRISSECLGLRRRYLHVRPASGPARTELPIGRQLSSPPEDDAGAARGRQAMDGQEQPYRSKSTTHLSRVADEHHA